MKLPDDIPFELGALVGCGVLTGWGAAMNAAAVRPGQAVVVYGAGGVGINAVQGAAYAGARPLVVVDPVEFKREKALELGATHAFAKAAEALEFVTAETGGRLADHALVTVSVLSAETVNDAVNVVGKRGTVTIAAMGKADEFAVQVHAGMLIGLRATDPGHPVRQLQPPGRHPADLRGLPGRAPQARRAHHHALQARPGQPGLPGHARRQEPARHDHPRAPVRPTMETAMDVPANTLSSPLVEENTMLVGGQWLAAASTETIDVVNPATGERAHPRCLAAAPPTSTPRSTQPRQPSPRGAPPAPPYGLRCCGVGRRSSTSTRRRSRPSSPSTSAVPPRGPRPLGGILQFIAGQVDKLRGESLPTHTPTTLGLTVREPYGVVAAIIPWNAPAPMFIHDVASAIGAGNTIVVKPAEDAPLASLALARLAEEAGIPPGVINVITGYGHEAGAALAGNGRIRRLSFTGSPQTGAAVMAACAKNLTPVHLELGGKSPHVVFADADLDKAVPTIVGGITMNRARSAWPALVSSWSDPSTPSWSSGLRRRSPQVSIGRWDEQVQMGPLVSARQRERVLGYVEAGKAEGARLVAGGGTPAGESYDDGFFVEPTLFDNVDPQSTDRPGGDLRSGPVGDPGRRRGDRDRGGERDRVRPGRLRVDA